MFPEQKDFEIYVIERSRMKNTACRNAAYKYGTLCGLRRHSIDDGESLPMALRSKIDTTAITHE